MSEYYISHTGVKGMKWGVRKYQNEDGTLTGIGKAHYKSKLSRQQYRQEKSLRSQEIKAEKSQSERAAKHDKARRKGRVMAAVALTAVGTMAVRNILKSITDNQAHLENVRTSNTMRLNKNTVDMDALKNLNAFKLSKSKQSYESKTAAKAAKSAAKAAKSAAKATKSTASSVKAAKNVTSTVKSVVPFTNGSNWTTNTRRPRYRKTNILSFSTKR